MFSRAKRRFDVSPTLEALSRKARAACRHAFVPEACGLQPVAPILQFLQFNFGNLGKSRKQRPTQAWVSSGKTVHKRRRRNNLAIGTPPAL